MAQYVYLQSLPDDMSGFNGVLQNILTHLEQFRSAGGNLQLGGRVRCQGTGLVLMCCYLELAVVSLLAIGQ